MIKRKKINKFIYTFCFGIILFSASSALAVTRTWDGGGATNNWSEAANWSDDTVPVAADTAAFNGTSVKDATIDVDVTVTSITVSSLYTGTISQGSSNLTVTGGYTQSGGTFTGGTGSIVVNGNFSLTNSAFTATDGTSTIGGAFSVNSSTFTPNGGTVVFTGSTNPIFNVTPSGTLAFDNFELNKGSSAAGITVSSGDTLQVNGNLSLTNGQIFSGGTLEALGAVTIANTFDGGTGLLLIGGTATRTVTIPAPLAMPQLTVNAPNTTVNTSGTGTISFAAMQIQSVSSMTNGAADFSFGSSSPYSQSGGTFNAGSGTLTLLGNFTQSGGIFNGGGGNISVSGTFSVTNATFTASSGTTSFSGAFFFTNGTFIPNGGTVEFTGIFNTSFDIFPNGTLAFNNVEINKSSDAAGVVLSDILQVNGDLILTNGRILGVTGTLEALGAVTIANTFDGGDGQLLLGGNATRTVTIPAPLSMPRFTVNAPNTTINTSGTGTISFSSQVALQNAVSVTNGAADFSFANQVTQSGGVFNVGSGAMTFQSAFTQTGGTFTGSGSTLDFQNNLTVNGGTFTASSGNTFIANGFNVNNAIFQPNGGTIILTGIFNTNFSALPEGTVALNNVEINKSSDAAGLGIQSTTMQINGTFTLTNGRIVGAAGGTPQVNGNLTIASTFDGGDGKIAFGGGNVQTFQNNGGILPTGAWTLNKTGGTVNLLSDLDISNGTSNFTLTNGTITTGANTVIAGTRNIFNTNGFIIGGLQRTFTASGSRLFAVGTTNGFAPVTINATAGTFGAATTFTVRSNDGTLAGASTTQSITRNWGLEPGAGGITTANLTFNYLQTDVPGGANESNFTFLRRNGGMTTNEGISTLDTTNNIAVLNGVTSFSDWSLGALAPTAANVIVGGRILTDTGRGISRARLSLTDVNGNTRSAMTNPFGYYRFDNVEAGATYVISVAHKSYQFANPTQIIFVAEQITNVDFIAENQVSTNGKAEISGRITDHKGNGLANVEIELSGGGLKEPVAVHSDEAGNYLFEGIDAGSTYIINVIDKQRNFAPRVLFVGEDMENIDFSPVQ